MGLDVAAPASLTSGLLTDHYELTMVEAALRSGVARNRAVFEVFTRSLPPGRRYGVVAGTGRLLESLTSFRFERAELDWLSTGSAVT
jgi:nicotinate phosphoribosyltransferase